MPQQIKRESDREYLSKNPEIKQAIIGGLNTPLSECSEILDWHDDILTNREQAIAVGNDEFEDWAIAKAALRNLGCDSN